MNLKLCGEEGREGWDTEVAGGGLGALAGQIAGHFPSLPALSCALGWMDCSMAVWPVSMSVQDPRVQKVACW